MKTEAEIKHEYEATKAQRDEWNLKFNKAVDTLGRFPYGSRDNKIAWQNVTNAQGELSFLSIRLGTLSFVLDMPKDCQEEAI